MTGGLCEWRYVSPRAASYRIDLFVVRGTFSFFSSRDQDWLPCIPLQVLEAWSQEGSRCKGTGQCVGVGGHPSAAWHSLTNFFMTFSTLSFWTFIKLLCNVFPAQIIPLSSSFSTLPYDPVPVFWGSFVERVTFLRTNCLSPRALWN